VFNGIKTYTPGQLQQFLSVNSNSQDNPFILPVSNAEQMLNSIIDNLEIDPFPVPKGQRSSRCTGAAIDLTVSLIETIFPMIVFVLYNPGTKAHNKTVIY